MIELRPFARLGKSDHGWLKANFHFSFAEYRDPARVHWGALRVWNNDRIAPGTGFPPHPHRDMEIVTYVMKGAITHEDHLGNRGRTEAGQIQVMSAGQGIRHAEYNRESDETELFQIWVLPNREGVPARWETVPFPAEARDGRLVPLASGRGDAGAIPLHADASLRAGTLKAGQTLRQALAGKPAYLVPARGRVEVRGAGAAPVVANARDGVAVVDQEEIELVALEDSEIVLVETDRLN
ncbi:MAG: pirin family protein [Alphaproteobacteria bacterium]|nr:pirin family protein [Alphaproteobacteria bacterium]